MTSTSFSSGVDQNLASQQEDLHHAAQTRSYHIPSPPRLNVPPPMFAELDLTLEPYSAADYPNGEIVTLERLGKVDFRRYFASTADWKYEQRRAAQEILPFLYLGPSMATKNSEVLREAGITLLYAVRSKSYSITRLLDGSKVADQLGITFGYIDVDNDQELISAFPRATNYIGNHLIEMLDQGIDRHRDSGTDTFTYPGKVLVYCESGNERSAAVVAAFLMSMYHLDPVKAIRLIQSQRFCVNFSDSIKNLLTNYNDILEARRGTNLALPSLLGNGGRLPILAQSSKRKLHEVMVEDSDMTDPSADTTGADTSFRYGSAPFADPREDEA
ncbi:MAG: stretch-activated cation channel mid1 [Chaenotheca gracillima]|nr:MAG: stretch-activated cation channel mid1 [Chaenotheca gracillima]